MSYASPNPYAAPLTDNPFGNQPAKPTTEFAGMWRQGKLLVLHKLAPLPDICVKTNQPATRRLRRNLQWHHPAISLTIFAGLIVYVVLALVLTKRATIFIPMVDQWHARRKRRLLITTALLLASAALFVLGCYLALSTNEGGYALLILLSFVLLIVGFVYGQVACRMVAPKRITDEYVWLKGVHPDYLDRLPVWPYQI